MKTNYVLSEKDKQLVHEHLKSLFDPQQELIRTIANSFTCSYKDAEKYAEKLKRMTLVEYRNAFGSVNNVEL